MDYFQLCQDVLYAARKQDYTGYSKFDALNSPLLSILSMKNKWLRIGWTQLVNRCPLHIRPLLGVRRSRNPKGIALFVRAYLYLYERSRDPALLAEARTLLAWLLQNASPDQPHLCWGYNFIWQNTIFLQDINEPNAVVTVFVGEALLHAYDITGEDGYLNAARSVGDFILHQLPVLHETSDERAIAYTLREVDAVVLNNQVLTGAFLVKLWKHTREDSTLRIVQKQMEYTVNRRTDYDAWYYTFPREKSPIRHDNYHTGGILDGLLEYYETTGDDRYLEVYWRGLAYYQCHLFESNGAPRWMSDQQYPYDIHGSAQGIITFIKAGLHRARYRETALKIGDWTIRHLYRPRTRDFAYRQGRWVKWNYSLMRWCNAWMTRALGELCHKTG